MTIIAAVVVEDIVCNIIMADSEAIEELEKTLGGKDNLRLYPTNGVPVAIGDIYADGSFYRDGVLVEPIEEAEEAEESVTLTELTEAYTEGVEGIE